MANTVKVKLVKGLIGTRQDHRATVRGLGYCLEKFQPAVAAQDQ